MQFISRKYENTRKLLRGLNENDITRAIQEIDNLDLTKKDENGALTDVLKGLTFCKYPYNSNKKIVLALIEKLGHFNYHSHKKDKILDYVSDELKADKDVVLAAVKKDGISLKYASANLKADKEVVLAAVEKSEYALNYASDELKADKEVILAAVKHHPTAFQFVPNDFKEDPQNKALILAAVTKYGNTLMYLPQIWRDDEDIMLAAIKQNRLTIHFASDKLKNKKEIVLAALQPENQEENKRQGVCNMIFDYEDSGFGKHIKDDPEILALFPEKKSLFGGYKKNKSKRNKTKRKKRNKTKRNKRNIK
jgi:hypothetical protein